ncbi:EAL domain-containing protein [Photobacterium minamisatsumaniensis]|uniref:EAL domain-containing protein n=1 Tax=Photobacterium minamisatsumaniensis TaxID=2910233 RepID=UPI003D0C9B96
MAVLLFVHLEELKKGTEQSAQSIQSIIGSSYKDIVDSNSLLLSGYLSNELKDSIYLLDFEHVNLMVEHLHRYEIIEDVIIFDHDGIIIHDGTDKNIKVGEVFDNSAVVNSIKIGSTYNYQGEYSIDIGYPVMIDESVIAGIYITMPLDDVIRITRIANENIINQLDNHKANLTERSIIYFTLTVLFASACVFIISQRLISPIYQLTRHIASMKQGDYRPFKVKRQGDEIGTMIGKFNSLCHLLEDHDRKLKELAYYDALTFLPNRHLFKRTIEEHRETNYFVLFMDLDGFKSINDNYGHQIGDKVLIEVAYRIRASLRIKDKIISLKPQNMVARVGGDEFVIYLNDVNGKSEVELIANRLISAVKKPILIDDNELYVNTSIGVFQCYDAKGVEQSIKNADIALYEAKRRGKGRYVHYDHAMDLGIQYRYRLENKLQSTLKSLSGYFLEFQPQFNLADYELVGVEVLIRWQDDEFGVISSVDLTKIAEGLNILNELTRWQIIEVINFYESVREYVSDDFYFSLNLGTRQVMDQLNFDRILRYLDNHQVKPSLFRIEIPESSFVHYVKDVRCMISKVKAHGFDVWLDNVGASQTSLKLVSELKLDGFKIDSSFFIHPSRENELIVSALISMAKKMGIGVIANGVESIQSEDFLRKEQCLVAQGAYFAKPMSKSHLKYILQCFGSTLQKNKVSANSF